MSYWHTHSSIHQHTRARTIRRRGSTGYITPLALRGVLLRLGAGPHRSATDECAQSRSHPRIALALVRRVNSIYTWRMGLRDAASTVRALDQFGMCLLDHLATDLTSLAAHGGDISNTLK